MRYTTQIAIFSRLRRNDAKNVAPRTITRIIHNSSNYHDNSGSLNKGGVSTRGGFRLELGLMVLEPGPRRVDTSNKNEAKNGAGRVILGIRSYPGHPGKFLGVNLWTPTGTS